MNRLFAIERGETEQALRETLPSELADVNGGMYVGPNPAPVNIVKIDLAELYGFSGLGQPTQPQPW